LNTQVDNKNKEIKIILKDDGRGFDITKLYSGNGLKNMKQRAEIISGKLDIQSHTGGGITSNGTIVQFSCEIP
jgi:signal transduction histidine kinase